MALATRCPHCKTAFRVASDQLKLRAGLVRCGTCKEIFNGIENLLHPDEDLASANAGPVAAVPTVSVQVESSQGPQGRYGDMQAHDATAPAAASGYAANYAPVTLVQHRPAPATPVADPATETTAQVQEETEGDEGEPEAGAIAGVSEAFGPVPGLRRAAANNDEDAAILTAPETVSRPKPKSRPAPVPAATVPDDMPDFVARAQQRSDMRRAVTPALVAGSVVLGVALICQTIYASRTALAAGFPALRPLLDQGCRMLGCNVGLPMQIESVSIESSDFQPVPDTPDRFLLTVLLRNRSTTVQAWPTIELTLNDASDKAVGRRLIAPREYLAAGQTGMKGFSAGSEQAIRLYFDLARMKASGYRVYLFYP